MVKKIKMKLYTNPYLGLLVIVSWFVIHMYVFGHGPARITRVIISEHEYTEGIPIEFSGARSVTVSYIYNVKGKKYGGKMRTALFYCPRKIYTVVYMQNKPNISFLKEHATALMIQNMISLILLSLICLPAIYCIVKKHIWRK